MTRKDYEMIAEAIRDANEEHWAIHGENAEGVEKVADYIADGCKADNPRFDRRRFLKACGFDA